MTQDHGRGGDLMGVLATAGLAEGGRERTTLLVSKWDGDQTEWARQRLGLRPAARLRPSHFAAVRVAPYDVFEYRGNLITRAGWAQLFSGGVIGTTPTKFSTTVGRIGIGSQTTAAAATDTALGSVTGMSGSGSNWILCAANPVVVTTATPCTVVFTATFGANDAVGAWNEFGIDQGTANSTAGTPTVTAVAPLMNHSTNIGAGTKAGGTWTATATLSFT